MRFNEALEHCVSNGARITRKDWKDEGKYIYYIKGRDIPINKWKGDRPSEEERKRGYITIKGHFDMCEVQGERTIGYSISQADILSDQWEIYETPEEREERLKRLKESLDEVC